MMNAAKNGLRTVAGCRRRWRAAACAAGIVAAMCGSGALAEELYGTFTGAVLGTRVAFERNDRTRVPWAGTLGFQLDSGEQLLVFCIQLDVPVGQGSRYKTSGPVEDLPNGCQLRYILDNYPGSSADTAEEAASRQLAIWHFSDNVDLTTITNTQSAIRARAIAIADEAAAGPCPQRRTTPPDLRLLPATSSAPRGTRLSYSVTADVLDAGHSVHVTVSGPAALDGGGQEASLELDASGAAVFGVTGTGVGTSTVRVELPYRIEAGTVLSTLDESSPTQRLVMAQHTDLVAEASASASWLEQATGTPVPTGTTPPTTRPSSTLAAATTQVVASATATETSPASITSTPRPGTTSGPATAQVKATPQVPAGLPRTGGGTERPWLPAAAICILVGIGLKSVRRRLARRPTLGA